MRKKKLLIIQNIYKYKYIIIRYYFNNNHNNIKIEKKIKKNKK